MKKSKSMQAKIPLVEGVAADFSASVRSGIVSVRFETTILKSSLSPDVVQRLALPTSREGGG